MCVRHVTSPRVCECESQVIVASTVVFPVVNHRLGRLCRAPPPIILIECWDHRPAMALAVIPLKVSLSLLRAKKIVLSKSLFLPPCPLGPLILLSSCHCLFVFCVNFYFCLWKRTGTGAAVDFSCVQVNTRFIALCLLVCVLSLIICVCLYVCVCVCVCVCQCCCKRLFGIHASVFSSYVFSMCWCRLYLHWFVRSRFFLQECVSHNIFSHANTHAFTYHPLRSWPPPAVECVWTHSRAN